MFTDNALELMLHQIARYRAPNFDFFPIVRISINIRRRSQRRWDEAFWIRSRTRPAGHSSVRLVFSGTSLSFVFNRFLIARAAGTNAFSKVNACQSISARAPTLSW
jgi:hypothetical protein